MSGKSSNSILSHFKQSPCRSKIQESRISGILTPKLCFVHCPHSCHRGICYLIWQIRWIDPTIKISFHQLQNNPFTQRPKDNSRIFPTVWEIHISRKPFCESEHHQKSNEGQSLDVTKHISGIFGDWKWIRWW